MTTVAPEPARVTTRVTSVDVLRGVVMVLMAIDHVRVYSGVPAGGPTAGVFFTRWVTHFCAPLFVFLAGTSAFLLGRPLPRAELTRYLAKRGALLILLEVTVGAILTREPAARDRACLRIGLAATALFVIAAGTGALLNRADDGPPLLFQVLNQRKYPASQLFLLMTLGPAIALVPFAEGARGAGARFFEVFGRVPMFYYLLHIPVIHALSRLVWFLWDGSTHAGSFATAPYVYMPDARWPLWLLYAVFVVAIAVLYVPCRWYASLKQRRRDVWLRYI